MSFEAYNMDTMKQARDLDAYEIERLEIALSAANELCERYKVALRKLVNEISGSLYLEEREMRALIGNTNFECIKLRIDETKGLLAADKSNAEPK